MLCSSGFLDDVIFSHNGPYGSMWLQHHELTDACAASFTAFCMLRYILTKYWVVTRDKIA